MNARTRAAVRLACAVPAFVMTFTVADGKATKFSFTREGQAFDAVRVQ